VPEDVQAVGWYVFGLAQELQTVLESGSRDVEALTSGGWSSDAATAFSAGWNECRDGGLQVMRALAGMAEKLGITASNYLAPVENVGREHEAVIGYGCQNPTKFV
jgi:hypothetical protein